MTSTPDLSTIAGDEPEALSEWRCFHCGDVFTTTEAARSHFGEYDGETPLCIEATNSDAGKLIATNREIWDRLRKAWDQEEALEHQLGNFEYTARKLTGKPGASTSDLTMAWDSMEGRVLAAEAAINAAPKWLRRWLRRRSELSYLKEQAR